MKWLSVIYENFRKCKKARTNHAIFSLLILAIVLSSCSVNKEQSPEKTLTIYPTTQTETPVVITITPTLPFTTTPTITPTEIKVSSYRQIDSSLNVNNPVINTTQGPVVIQSTQPVTEKLLYYKNIVTIQLGSDLTVFSYLNLDDIDNNGLSNSDIAIERTGRGYDWYLFEPINGAVYYHSDNKSMDLNSCLKHFPISGMDEDQYFHQGMNFDSSGGSFCIITNEDRMAIVQFIENSIEEDENFTENLSFIVTVYSEILK